MRRSIFHALIAWSTLAVSASADTVIVDDDGGPGVDFTDIQTAVDAASNGDVLIVEDGTYAGFTIQAKRLAVVGRGGVDIQGVVTVQNQATKRCELSSLSMPCLRLVNCSGAVFLDALTVGPPGLFTETELVLVDRCVDVRMRDSSVSGVAFFTNWTGADALRVVASRMEVSSSTLIGSGGTAGVVGVLAGDGGNGVVLENGARVHLNGSIVTGNEGGHTFCRAGCATPADGGIGLLIDSTSNAILAGNSEHYVAGGLYGGRECCIGNGSMGLAIDNAGQLRKSGIGAPTVLGNNGPAEVHSGSLVLPVPADPWLQVLGTPANGSFDTVLRIWGPPGLATRINLGRVPILVDTPGIAVELLVGPLRTINLGFIPPSGYVDYAWPQLGFFSTGTPFLAQAITVLPTGEVRRTNSAPIVVR